MPTHAYLLCDYPIGLYVISISRHINIASINVNTLGCIVSTVWLMCSDFKIIIMVHRTLCHNYKML